MSSITSRLPKVDSRIYPHGGRDHVPCGPDPGYVALDTVGGRSIAVLNFQCSIAECR